MSALLVLAPIAVAAYLSGPQAKSDLNIKRSQGDAGTPADWVPRNVVEYCRDPILTQKAIYGDSDQISLEHPAGPVSDAMSSESNPVKALNILAEHEIQKDRTVVSLWKEFIRPTREIVVRTVDRPLTQVNILQPGALVDQRVKTGVRFWDRPVPRSTGIDRYYPRKETIPWYAVP